MVQQAKIIRLTADGVFNHDIALKVGVSRPTVQLWRNRFLALRLDGLKKDAPRSGRLPKISSCKVVSIVNATLHTTPPDATQRDLINAITSYIETHNQNPRIFTWHASVERIMTKIAKCKEALVTLH